MFENLAQTMQREYESHRFKYFEGLVAEHVNLSETALYVTRVSVVVKVV